MNKIKLFWTKIKDSNWYKWCFNIKHNCKLIKSSYVDIVTEKMSKEIAIVIDSEILKEITGISYDTIKENRLKQNEEFYNTIAHIKRHLNNSRYWYRKFIPKVCRKKYL